jgi:dTDP-4-dehydrorhamnose 3,5-epimerase
MIDGVIVTPRKPIADERGRLMECFRSDEPDFEQFGQVYVTTAYPGVVKAWHYHKKQTDNFICVHGMLKVVLYDSRENSPTRGEVNEFFMGLHHPIRLRIPRGVLHGFKCISEQEAVLINVPTECYNYKQPDEFRMPANDPSVPYDWARKDR